MGHGGAKLWRRYGKEIAKISLRSVCICNVPHTILKVPGPDLCRPSSLGTKLSITRNLSWKFCRPIMTVLTLYRLLLVVALSQAFTSCYYPDSIYIASDQPCIVNGTQGSFCCGSQGIPCLSDKVSYCNHSSYSTSGNSYARGSCTDQSFRSPACPQLCLAPNKSASGMF